MNIKLYRFVYLVIRKGNKRCTVNVQRQRMSDKDFEEGLLLASKVLSKK